MRNCDLCGEREPEYVMPFVEGCVLLCKVCVMVNQMAESRAMAFTIQKISSLKGRYNPDAMAHDMDHVTQYKWNIKD